MSRSIELFFLCIFLVATGNTAPWSDNNELREHDLEWHCHQLCERLLGKPIFYSTNSTCSCVLEHEDPEINWKRIKNNAKMLGLMLELINSNSKKILKRETPAEKIERIKKLIESKKQEKAIAPMTLKENKNNNKEEHDATEIENKEKMSETTGKENEIEKPILSETPSEKIKKLKELIEIKKRTKMNDMSDKTDAAKSENNDDKTIKSPLQTLAQKDNKSNEKKIENPIEKNKLPIKLPTLNKAKTVENKEILSPETRKLENDNIKEFKTPVQLRMEKLQERRAKIRAQLKERILAARSHMRHHDATIKKRR